MQLSVLAAAVGASHEGPDAEVSGITIDSRQVTAGDLFVAIPGLTRNGELFIPEAMRAGAAAICARRPVPGMPCIVAEDPRRTLAALAAAFHEHPGRALRLLGITGSLGKTSTALLLEQALSSSGSSVGVIGSLGVRFEGDVIYTRMTTPEAPAIHAALAQMRRDGADTVIVEITSHSLRLERVAGLRLALGILTNLVPDEHLEFHPTAEDYLRTKARFLDMLEPGAPLVANADDANVRSMVRQSRSPVVFVSGEGAPDADVRIEDVTASWMGSTFVLRVCHPLPGLAGRLIGECRLPISLAVLGEQQVANAALACTAALLAGAAPEAVAGAMARARPMHRRMQILHESDPTIIDDTVGNAVSIHHLFDVVDRLAFRRLHVVYAIRGSRGTAINATNAAALAQRLSRHDARLIVTSSEETTGPRDRVTAAERDAVRAEMERLGVSHSHSATLDPAVREVLEDVGEGDLVLLLGAQGMDSAGRIVRDVLGLERRSSVRR